jgi:hypothetical protein
MKWCNLCNPSEALQARAELLRPMLPASRDALARSAGITPGQVDHWARWVRENNYYAPFSLLSQRGGAGARYTLSLDQIERAAHSLSRSSSLVTGIRTLMRDVILPSLVTQGTPPAAVRFVERGIETTMQGVEELLLVAEDEQVADLGIPDDISTLSEGSSE